MKQATIMPHEIDSAGVDSDVLGNSFCPLLGLAEIYMFNQYVKCKYIILLTGGGAVTSLCKSVMVSVDILGNDSSFCFR